MANSWFEGRDVEKLEAFIEKHGERLKERYSTDDVCFALWMHGLNRRVQALVMVSFDDLEDWGYRDAYDADMLPSEAAVAMIRDNGWGAALGELVN